MVERFFERKQNAPLVDVEDLLETCNKESYVRAVEKATPYRNYMMEEAIKQYCDYYESD